MSGRLDFEYKFNNSSAKQLAPDTPMRVYFLGGFSGATPEDGTIKAIVRIDIDNFDQVMAKMGPTLRLPSGHTLTFDELEDFHPDTLFDNSLFENLKRLKNALGNTNTAEQAAQEILTRFNIQDNGSTDEIAKTENKDTMIERLLGQKPSGPSSLESTTSNMQLSGGLDAFIADIISPNIIKNTLPEHKSLMAFIDTAMEELMNSILHLAEFQQLESAWRGVRDVVFNEEYDEENQFFYLIDANRDALEKAVIGDPQLVSKINQHIKDTDVTTYDVLVANYQFSASHEDIKALNYLASVGEALNCQIISAADDSLVNSPDEPLWQEFRQTPQASNLALIYPKVLMRIPYGKKHEEIDAFAFEEFRSLHHHGELLWGNPAFASARMLMRQFHNQVTFDPQITELPAFVYTDDNEKKLHPCGEYLLSELQLIEIRKQGITPFASFRNKNCIRLFGDKITAVSNK